MKIRKLRSIICLCLVFALLSPTFTFAISDGASDVAEKTIFDNAVDMRGNGSRSTTYTARIMQGNTNEEDIAELRRMVCSTREATPRPA